MAQGDIIPDGEKLYRYAKPEAFPPGQIELPDSIFNELELSCDWERYCSDPFQSYHISEGKTVVIQITVHEEIKYPTNPKRTGQRIKDWEQEVIHDPIAAEDDIIHGANEAHSLIKGTKKAAVKNAIRNNSERIN